MRNILLGCGLLLTTSMLPAVQADVLKLPAPAPAPATATASAALPIRGESQRTVLSRYGEPAKRHAAVGGGSAAQPPITRWDYAGFSVFFENSHVVDAVVPGAPAPLFNTGELRATGGG